MPGGRATVRVSNIPPTAVAGELFEYFESNVGSVYACEIATARKNWKPRGYGRVQFESFPAAERACLFAAQDRLPYFQCARLSVLQSLDDIIVRASDEGNRIDDAEVFVGNLVEERTMEVLESWDMVSVEVLPERKKVLVFLEDGSRSYKLEIMFGDVRRSCGCYLGEKGKGGVQNGILLQKISVGQLNSDFFDALSGLSLDLATKILKKLHKLDSTCFEPVQFIRRMLLTSAEGSQKTLQFNRNGIGKISLSFARQVARKCGLSDTPSAFQIRYGGYKGVVAVDRTSFRKLSLRPSMKKFDSSNTMLNITKWSDYLPCYLNREIICLLSTLGIEDEIFELMQQTEIRLLDEILVDCEAALRVVDRLNGFETKTTKSMLMHGFNPNSEPYVSMMLRAYHDYQLADIKSKCRIFVPKGRVLIGCLDETGTLNYGEVYLRITTKDNEQQSKDHAFFDKADQTSAVVIGKVVVTKNPCLHPGDIRVLEAIYEPGLDEMGLVDCIVFPQKGPRPHPNECSGGDLDGDLYFVCWDENLIPLEKLMSQWTTLGRKPRLLDHEVSEEVWSNAAKK
ncbi:hypothetical protein J5N97_004997 [Dioscorea zingiberensis]|uniref:RNA-dependent RNA polymerase n=1 Tax=Dioscorea zingiberensis TaxID=325984 RepID=A0A9D5HSC2_9LILI|nr:hypothetical protein J5N97_004997 [Dioscorea zingiberensis]